jgi:hypothetical protein
VCVCVASPPAPPLVQLHCIHCALKTLAGPGEELKMDDEVFVTALRLLVKEIPIHFERWDIALDCLDLSLCKRRETRSSVVLGFVRLLFLHSSHMLSDSVGLALLAMANTVLLKYPRVRCEMQAPPQHGKQEDDEVIHPHAYSWSSHLFKLSYRLRALSRHQIRSSSVGPETFHVESALPSSLTNIIKSFSHCISVIIPQHANLPSSLYLPLQSSSYLIHLSFACHRLEI